MILKLMLIRRMVLFGMNLNLKKNKITKLMREAKEKYGKIIFGIENIYKF